MANAKELTEKDYFRHPNYGYCLRIHGSQKFTNKAVVAVRVLDYVITDPSMFSTYPYLKDTFQHMGFNVYHFPESQVIEWEVIDDQDYKIAEQVAKINDAVKLADCLKNETTPSFLLSFAPTDDRIDWCRKTAADIRLGNYKYTSFVTEDDIIYGKLESKKPEPEVEKEPCEHDWSINKAEKHIKCVNCEKIQSL